jgi:hypothetical protein
VRAALIVRPPNHAGAVVLARTAKVRALPRINAYSDNCAGAGFDRSAIDAPGRRESAPGIQPLRNAMLAPSVARLLKDGVLSEEGGGRTASPGGFFACRCRKFNPVGFAR